MTQQSLKRLDSIFEGQAASRLGGSDANAAEERSLIRFTIEGSVFAVSVESVIEVTEMLQIVPYPEPHYGHLGIVNLRGHIIPVLAFGEQSQEQPKLKVAEIRLLVLEFAPGRRFCTPVSVPKKVSLSLGKDAATQRIASIDGMPARLISEKDFPATLGLNAPEES